MKNAVHSQVQELAPLLAANCIPTKLASMRSSRSMQAAATAHFKSIRNKHSHSVTCHHPHLVFTSMEAANTKSQQHCTAKSTAQQSMFMGKACSQAYMTDSAPLQYTTIFCSHHLQTLPL
jgi:hypothetical protein